nr:MAG TPA: hypothetical protein [Caudoviricetes sp.]DAO24156.1 MAG TPA: hypothetical protein [Caudoviricetes sp.]
MSFLLLSHILLLLLFVRLKIINSISCFIFQHVSIFIALNLATNLLVVHTL